MESRNYQSGAAASPPAAPASPSNGYPTNGNPSTATATTVPGDFWYYKIGEELRAIISNAGITPSDSDLAQAAKAIQSGKMMSVNAGGTVNALTASLAPVLAAYIDGQPLYIKAAGANTSTAPTLSLNGLTAKTIVKGANVALVAGDIAGSGHRLELVFDGSLDKWVLLNPATGIGPASLLADPGYQRFADGLIYAWCKGPVQSVNSGGNANYTVNYPITFSSVFAVQVSTIQSSSAANFANAACALQGAPGLSSCSVIYDDYGGGTAGATMQAQLLIIGK